MCRHPNLRPWTARIAAWDNPVDVKVEIWCFGLLCDFTSDVHRFSTNWHCNDPMRPVHWASSLRDGVSNVGWSSVELHHDLYRNLAAGSGGTMTAARYQWLKWIWCFAPNANCMLFAINSNWFPDCAISTRFRPPSVQFTIKQFP